MMFQDPYLNEIACTDPFRWKTYRFLEIVISKQQNAKSVTDASNWVMFISRNRDTRTLDQSILSRINSPIIIPSMDFISGQPISLTNPIHRIPVQCVNKLGKRLFCDRAILNCLDFYLYISTTHIVVGVTRAVRVARSSAISPSDSAPH